MFGNIIGNKSNIHERDWSKFDRENFILDYFSVDWEDLLKIDELNADNSTKTYLDKINMLLNTYAPLKRINKCKFFISLKTVASSLPMVHFLDNDDTVTNPYDIVNNFNNYFASIVETTKKA